MGDDLQQGTDFASVKERLSQIAEAVDDEGLSLDAALDLYEEAVALGLKASDLLEVGIGPSEDEGGAPGDAGGDEPTEQDTASAGFPNEQA